MLVCFDYSEKLKAVAEATQYLIQLQGILIATFTISTD